MLRLKAQRVAGVTVSSSIPAPITDADVTYIVNTADFTKSYSHSKATSWQAIDKTKLEYYSVSLTLATGELRVDKGVDVKFDQNGNFYSYKPSGALFHSK